MNNLRIIKRYQNRKLYDTFQKCYVTLEEIFQIIRKGDEIKVIDTRSKEDITSMTKIKILFANEKKQFEGDISIIERVIRSEQGTLTNYIRSIEKGIL